MKPQPNLLRERLVAGRHSEDSCAKRSSCGSLSDDPHCRPLATELHSHRELQDINIRVSAAVGRYKSSSMLIPCTPALP
jgi:hypothetical protein